MKLNIEERVAKAVENLDLGYNCMQSVFLAYTDQVDIMNVTKSVMSSHRTDLGKFGEICGTIIGMSMLAGFKYPVAEDEEKKSSLNHAVVKHMADIFKERNNSMACKVLLADYEKQKKSLPHTEEFESIFHDDKCPCKKFVADAAELAGRMFQGEFDELG